MSGFFCSQTVRNEASMGPWDLKRVDSVRAL